MSTGDLYRNCRRKSLTNLRSVIRGDGSPKPGRTAAKEIFWIFISFCCNLRECFVIINKIEI